MIKLKDLIRERKVLSVFDFDDTLAKSDAWIYVTRLGRTIKKLDPAEFAVYKPRRGEEFDFRDFDAKLQNGRLIKRNAELLKKQLDKARREARGTRKVTILTARRLGLPVTSFLKSVGIDAYVVPLGSADPQKKADWIEKQINDSDYDTVYFMDDSPDNITAVKRMLKRYPNVKSIVKQIGKGLMNSLHMEAGRIPRKKGQKRKSKKHSDLYTDEDPKGTIHGLKFATVKDAEASVRKIKGSGRKHAHKVQAAVAMEQRAKAAGKKSAAAVYRRYINSVKKSK